MGEMVSGTFYTWNYRNELIQSVTTNGTTTYTYDHTGQRVKKVNGTDTTLYPFGHYEVKNGEATKHIYLGDMLVATVEADTPAPKLFYNHLDHLGSTNAVTGDDGYLNQLLNYRPFGNTNIDNQYDTVNQTKRFTGHDYDESTGLSYMGARYQSGEEGRFMSMDPVFIHEIEKNLEDPQQLNSYSYTRNNPIMIHDPNGEDSMDAMQGFGEGITSRAFNTALSTVAVARGMITQPGETSAAVVQGMIDTATGAASEVHALSTQWSQTTGEYGALLDGMSDHDIGRAVGGATFDVGLIVAAGASTKALRGGTQAPATKIHGNSLDHPGPAYGYNIVDRKNGSILKIGESLNPGTRYSRGYLDSINGRVRVQTEGMSKRDVRQWETTEIKSYTEKNGERPKLNKADH